MACSRMLCLLIVLEALGCALADPPSTATKVHCSTTKGDFSLAVYPEWAPLGAARFLELVEDGFYTDIALYRCVDKFLVQFGITENPEKKHWHFKTIEDDPNLHKGIKKHYLSFAGGGANTRSTQLFIAFEDLDFLGKAPWEVPFGEVIDGGSVVDSFYKGNGDIPPFGKGPDQQMIHKQGNAYIRQNFPHTDFIRSCYVEVPAAHPKQPANEPIQPDTRTGTEKRHNEIIDKVHSSHSESDLLTSFLRKQTAGENSSRPSNELSALFAVVFLLVAIAVLCCLYQFKSIPSSGKSL